MSDTHNITITGMTRVRQPKPNKGGSIVLARFDAEVNGMSLIGCAFVRTERNGLTIWGPRVDDPHDPRHAIRFSNDSLQHAVKMQARETYRMLGGTDAEWVPRNERPQIAARDTA